MFENCFIKCVGFNRRERRFTIGKVYQVVNGHLTDDMGYTYTPDYCGDVLQYLRGWYRFEILDENGEPLPVQYCNSCGRVVMKDDCQEINNTYVCNDCFEEYYVECEDCGEIVYRFNTYSTTRGSVCEYCAENYYRECEDCGTYVHEDDIAWYNGDVALCPPCYESRVNRVIHDYYYKPLPIFYGAHNNSNALFMGVELEIDGSGESNDNARRIIDIANADNENVYIKHDGSINYGFEIVSHPATLDYHKNVMPWRDIMAEAVNMGYRSHNTETCGLHVHVSRKALGDSFAEEDETISKIVYFVENNWREILKFTRRTSSRLARWASRYGIEEDIPKTYEIAKNEGGQNRYKCINLQNNSTVEFRMFRGTLKHDTFIATLQFVNNICNICKTATMAEIEWFTWKDFLRKIDEKNNVELVEYLKTRGLYV